MQNDFGLTLATRMRMRRARLFWRGKFGLKWFLVWAVALLGYLVVGLQPVEATGEAMGELKIPEIGLTSEVQRLELDEGGLKTPSKVVGGYSRERNKTLLIGHATGVFQRLNEIEVGDTMVFEGKEYVVESSETVAKEEIRMREILAGEKQETLVLMTCAGKIYANGDASARLIVRAVSY